MGWTLYVHTNRINGKCYVGITSRKVEKRWGNNGIFYKPDRGENPNRHFWNAIKKYGWDSFDHEIIMENLTEYQAKEYERFYILHYDSYKNGYNSTYGGDGISGHKHSKKTRKQMSANRKGKKHTDEWSRRISESQTMKKRVICLETGEIYDSPRDCSVITGIRYAYILAVCRNATKSTNGLHFQYVDEKHKSINEIEATRNNRHRSKPVLCIETNVIYPSAVGCCRETGISKSCVERACKSHTPTHGLHFIYCCDDVDIEKVLKIKTRYRRRKVRCLDDNKVFSSISECAKYYGLNEGSINEVCRGRIKSNSIHGKHFEYVESCVRVS